MKSLIRKLFGQGSRLSDLELLILNAVRDCLSDCVADLWDKQICEINKVQRLPDDVEVNFYRMKEGAPTFDDALAFSNKSGELLIATVTIHAPNLSDTLTAWVWSVRGFLFSIEYKIEYKGSVKHFEEAAGMNLPLKMQADCVVEIDFSMNTIDHQAISFSLKGDGGGAIAVKILGYKYPNARDISDANRLKAEIMFNSGGCTFHYNTNVTTNDVKNFLNELKKVLSSLEGQASFLTDEEDVLLHVELSRLGSVRVVGELKETNSVKTKIMFELHSDQSFLSEVCSDLQKLNTHYPIIQNIANTGGKSTL